MKLQLKRSATLESGSAKVPQPSQLAFGEVALNYNSTGPKLFLKDSSNTVVSLTDQYLELSGGTLTGDLLLNGDPTSALMPATKQYTDSAITTLSNSINYPVTSVNGLTGGVSLNYANVGAPSTSGANATGTWGIGISGNAATASKWSNSRTLTFTGDVSGSTSLDGSANKSITITVNDDSHNHTISNVDGLQSALDGKLSSTGTASNSDELGGKTESEFVTTANNSTLRSDSRNNRGVTRLYRADNNSNYSVQTTYDGSRWRLQGYSGDMFHAECRVGYADTAGTVTTATNCTNFNVAADDSTNSTHYIIFTGGKTGNQRPNSDSSLKYNPSSNTITASTFAGNATSATSSTNVNLLADNSTNFDRYILFSSVASGNTRIRTDTSVRYNPSTNTLSVTNFAGKASTASKWHTARTLTLGGDASGSVSIDGSANKTLTVDISSITGDLTVSGITTADQFRTNNNWQIRDASNHALDFRAPGNSSGSSYFGLMQGSTYRGHIRWTTSNEIGFGNISAGWSFKCDNSGNCTATGNVTAYSDRTLKDDILPITDALKKVAAINGVTFVRNDIDDDSRHAGVIAQEVMTVLPEVVREDTSGKLTVAYGNIVGLLIEAIKELRQEVNELKN